MHKYLKLGEKLDKTYLRTILKVVVDKNLIKSTYTQQKYQKCWLTKEKPLNSSPFMLLRM